MMNLVKLYLKKQKLLKDQSRVYPDNIIGHLRCYHHHGHEYKLDYQRMINGGMGKMFVYGCIWCGRKKVNFI